MMGQTRDPDEVRNAAEQEKRRQNPHDSTHDPEFEMPDPEQVKRDIEQAERLYGEDEKKKPAA